MIVPDKPERLHWQLPRRRPESRGPGLSEPPPKSPYLKSLYARLPRHRSKRRGLALALKSLYAQLPRRRSRGRGLALAQRLLLAGGIILCGYAIVSHFEARAYNLRQLQELDEVIAARRAAESAAALVGGEESFRGARERARVAPLRSGLVGRIDVARLGISAAIMEGIDPSTLRGAVGHIPGTALPGDLLGNVGLAAHRDGLFSPLHGVEAGDRIRIQTPEGTHDYVVSGTTIVDPHETWVLDPAPRRHLTLVTCHPFNYFGPAPQRFVVHATAASAVAAEPGVATPPASSSER
jgi:sortase A